MTVRLAKGRARLKRTQIDRQLNWLVLTILLVLFCMCTTLAILSTNWESKQGEVRASAVAAVAAVA